MFRFQLLAIGLLVSSVIFSGCADIGEDMISGWAQSGIITTGSSKGISCQANFREDSIYTIQFSLIADKSVIVRPEATISMNINGNDVRRRISVVNGTSFSGTSRTVSIHLYDTLTAGMPGVLGVNYVANIQISQGIRPSTSRPPVLIPDQYIDALGVTHPFIGEFLVPPAGTGVILVPDNSGVTSVQITAAIVVPPTGPIQVFARQLSAAVSLTSYDPTLHDFVSIWPGTQQVSITNHSADLVGVSGLFGVDG